MPKVVSKKKVLVKIEEKARSHNSDWENESWAKGWLTKSQRGHRFKQSFCRVCNKDFRAHQADLQKHAATATHQKNLDSVQSNQKSMKEYSLDCKKPEKERDLKIVLYTACHGGIRSIDHLCSVLKKINPNWETLNITRNKCANLINYVIAPNMLKDLISDIGQMPYSLIVDDSIKTCICICIKYFSLERNKFVTDFLGLLEIEMAEAISFYITVKKFLREINLPLANCIGLGTDGGHNLCATSDSLFALLKSDNPNVQVSNCVCHAFNLASSLAAEELPIRSLDFLCEGTYNWFANSTNRRSEYDCLWDKINIYQEKNKKEHTFFKLSDTRWLSRYIVVNLLCENYFELQAYFREIVRSQGRYTARLLYDILIDNSNYFYLLLIRPILYEIHRVNLSFQTSCVTIGSAYNELKNLISLIDKKILESNVEYTDETIENGFTYLPLDCVDFGMDYYVAKNKIDLDKSKINKIETDALHYLRKLHLELVYRLPPNFKDFEKMNYLDPSNCLALRPKLRDFPFLDIFSKISNLDLLEHQYTTFLNVDWAELLDEKQLKNINLFWGEVYKYKNAEGISVFKELADYAISVLTLPSFSPVVARTFSTMNAIKRKARNETSAKLSENIMRVKIHLYARDICCKDYIPTQAMFNDFNTNNLYKADQSDENDISLEIEDNGEVFDLLNFQDDTSCINVSEL